MAKSKKQIAVQVLQKAEKLAFKAAAKANKIHGIVLTKLDKANTALEAEKKKAEENEAKTAAKKIAAPAKKKK